MSGASLTEREELILEAVVRLYVETAEPVGSRRVVERFDLGISSATVRNAMADLEKKGFLYHPHTSAGRMPTDLAYRYYVDTLMRPVRLTAIERDRFERELGEGESGALERLLHRAARALGLLTGELGIAIAPRPDEAVLESLELVALSSEKVLLVLRLRNGIVRTVYVDLPVSMPEETLVSVAMLLNERLAGQTLGEIRRTLPERLRDLSPAGDDMADELLRIVVRSGEELFAFDHVAGGKLHLGQTSVLARQPEFSHGSELKRLIELTERRDLLTAVLDVREAEDALRITIGAEHAYPEMNAFTVVTSSYSIAGMRGVIGVIGPTRMPYDKVTAMVDRASMLVSDLPGAASA